MTKNIDTNQFTYRHWIQLIGACLTGILIPLCFTGPAVVLPSLSQEIGGTPIELNWIVNGYILTYGSTMMAAGSLTDIYGRKRVWLLGLLSFTLITFLIPLATTVMWIDVLRLLQGAGGAAAFAGAMASLAQTFQGATRTRIFSLLGVTFGIGLAFGPIAAGWIVNSTGWRWVFIATAGISLLGLCLVYLYADESRDIDAKGVDWLGAISFTTALTLLTYGLLLAPDMGWKNITVIVLFIIALVLFLLFIRIELGVVRPMLDLSLFKNTRFIGVQVLAASPAFFFVTLIVMLPARFIGIDGVNAFSAGQMMIALAVPLLFVPFIAAWLSRWLTAGILSGIGLLLAALGLFWLGQRLSDGFQYTLVAPLLLIGVGIGLPWGLMDGMAVSVVEKERAGMATGIFNCVRVSADGIAIAVAGALFAFFIQHGLHSLFSDTDLSTLNNVANRIALGEINSATAILPDASVSLLMIYKTSFHWLLNILSGMAVITALLIFALLGKIHIHDVLKTNR